MHRYRAYGQLRDVPHVVVDGSAQPGTALVLSHWPGMPTPDGAARRPLGRDRVRVPRPPEAPASTPTFVTNNHFDQDGLDAASSRSTRPDDAQRVRERLIDIARAGDFGRFQDRDAAPRRDRHRQPRRRDRRRPVPRAARTAPELADHPERYRDHWAEEDEHISATEAALADGTITITEDPALDLAVVHVPERWRARTVHRFTMTDQGVAHPYAVFNATDRFVIVTVGAGAPELRYRYETWVHYTSCRPRPASTSPAWPRP